MIERESSGDGWQVRFVPTQGQRLVRAVPAVFLAFWLCGWFMGECFAGGALLAILAERFSWDMSAFGVMPRFHGPAGNAAYPVMAFLGVWLVLWTFGGISAIGALVTLLFGVPTLRWSAQGISLDTEVGAFRTRRKLTWEQAEALVSGPTWPVGAKPTRANTSPTALRLRALFVPLVDEGDRDQLLAWLREARGAAEGAATGADAAGGAPQYRAIG